MAKEVLREVTTWKT